MDANPPVTAPDAPPNPEPPAPTLRQRGYVAETFGAFFSDPRWFRTALLGGLITMVPILGSMAASGYALTWMRQVAWQVDDGLPSAKDQGEILTVGARAFVVRLAWGLVGALIFMVPTACAIGALGSMIFQDSMNASSVVGVVFAGIFVLAGTIVLFAITFLGEVAAVRSALYQRISAGMSLTGAMSMVKSHTEGFWKVIGTGFLAGLPALAVAIGVQLVTLWLEYAQDSSQVATQMATLLPLLTLPVSGITGFFGAVLQARAFGRWVREIDPRTLPVL